MIAEFERFHGAALRTIIASAPHPITIEAWDRTGRIDSYWVNSGTAIHLKHSSKRLPPWQFTFTIGELSELSQLGAAAKRLWLLLVCGSDGLVCLSDIEFRALVGSDTTPFIRIDRDPRSMYRIYGNNGKLRGAKANGVDEMIRRLFPRDVRKNSR